MRTLDKSEYTKVISLLNWKQMLEEDGRYALVNPDMSVASMSMYSVESGKLKDDIYFDCTGEYCDESYFAQFLEEESEAVELMFAKLVK